MYYLLKNPETMRKLREEIDTVLGDQTMQSTDLGKMPYCVGTQSHFHSVIELKHGI